MIFIRFFAIIAKNVVVAQIPSLFWMMSTGSESEDQDSGHKIELDLADKFEGLEPPITGTFSYEKLYLRPSRPQRIVFNNPHQ